MSDGDERKFDIWFRKRNPGMTYSLQAVSADVKRTWVNDITRILWQQAIRNRERSHTELLSSGFAGDQSVGVKRCRDINERTKSQLQSNREGKH